jgi:hypothetical protein
LKLHPEQIRRAADVIEQNGLSSNAHLFMSITAARFMLESRAKNEPELRAFLDALQPWEVVSVNDGVVTKLELDENGNEV